MSIQGSVGRPLAGIRVLDFTHAAAGPYATMFLGDLGADVIKIEKPGRGDGSRYMGEPMLGPTDSDYYLGLNRNKRDVLIDLGTPEGRTVAQQLATRCDVVVQNFRPGVMDRLELGFETLRVLRPGLVYCSISAFGPSGPWRDRPANDVVMQSVAGLMGVTGEVDGGPVRIGAPVSDYGTGLFALSGILAALHARASHPEGQHVEVNMLDSSLALMANYIPSVATLGKTIPRLGRGHAQIVPYQAFRCADGKYVMVGAFTQGFWKRLAHMLGHDEWVDDPRFATNAARLAHRAELLSAIEAIFATKPRAEWLPLLDEADVPSSGVFELHEAIALDQTEHNRTIVEVGEDGEAYHVVASPLSSDAWGANTYAPAPRMGADTEAVLREVAGINSAELERLAERRVIGLAEQAVGRA